MLMLCHLNKDLGNIGRSWGDVCKRSFLVSGARRRQGLRQELPCPPKTGEVSRARDPEKGKEEHGQLRW